MRSPFVERIIDSVDADADTATGDEGEEVGWLLVRVVPDRARNLLVVHLVHPRPVGGIRIPPLLVIEQLLPLRSEANCNSGQEEKLARRRYIQLLLHLAVVQRTVPLYSRCRNFDGEFTWNFRLLKLTILKEITLIISGLRIT